MSNDLFTAGINPLALAGASAMIATFGLAGTGESVGILLKTYAVASLFWLAYQFTQGLPTTLLAPEHFPKVLVVGIVGNLLPYLLFLWSIQRVHAERTAIVATLEPFVAAILAWLWFGQTLTLHRNCTWERLSPNLYPCDLGFSGAIPESHFQLHWHYEHSICQC